MRRNRALADVLIRHAHRSAAASGLPVFHIDETRQHGETFGERLADAFQQVFALGYQAVVAIGNDSPEIAGTDWPTICTALAAGKTVLGSTTRGGAYLIGLQAAQFQADSFADVTWQSAATLASLQAHLLAAGCDLHDQLPRLTDLNTRADLARLLATRRSPDGVLRILALLLHPRLAVPTQLATPAGTDRPCRLALRGPPGVRPPRLSAQAQA